jgi:cell division transport system ATP-binding protein
MVAPVRGLHQIRTNVTGPGLIRLVLRPGTGASLSTTLTAVRLPDFRLDTPADAGYPAGLSAANGYGFVDTRRPVLVLNDVTKTYPNGRDALKDVDLVVPEGDFVFLVGASGAGKSTLMKLLIRDELATQGTVILDGDDMARLPRRKVPIVRRKIGIVFQDFKLLPTKTVRENIAFALEVTGTSRRRIRPAVVRALALVGLTAQAEQYPKQLSGGEQQRTAIARALVHDPKIVIADEPTGNLDPLISWEILQLLLRINELGVTVLMATHDADIVTALRKRVVALEEGRVIRDEIGGGYHRAG